MAIFREVNLPTGLSITLALRPAATVPDLRAFCSAERSETATVGPRSTAAAAVAQNSAANLEEFAHESLASRAEPWRKSGVNRR
jgi:hypothetical protein